MASGWAESAIMYHELEKYYKQNSNQIKTRKNTTIIYVVLIIAILIINSLTPGKWFVKTILSLISVFFVTIITALLSQYITKQKNPDTIKRKGAISNHSDKHNDLTIIKKYLKSRGLLSEKALYTIKNHYLAKSMEAKTNHILEIFLTIATIATSLLPNNESTSENLTRSIVITTIVIIAILTIYFIVKSYCSYYRFFTGNDDLYETLEDITTQLYLETLQKDNKK